MRLVFVPEFLACELEVDLILQSSEPAVFLFPRVCLCWMPALTMDHGQASRWVQAPGPTAAVGLLVSFGEQPAEYFQFGMESS